MNEVWNGIATHLEQLSNVWFIFILAWFANFCFSLWYNIGIIQEGFEPKRLLKGVLKALGVALGSASLVVCVDLFVKSASLYDTDVGNMITIASILGTIGASAGVYAIQALETLREILSNTVKSKTFTNADEQKDTELIEETTNDKM